MALKRLERTQILIQGRRNLAEKMAGMILDQYAVEVLEAANSGLVMITVRESAQNSLFYPGEVLVTECKVAIEGQIGLGIVQGLDSDLTYWLAVIDAAYRANLPEVKMNEWKDALTAEKAWIADQRSEETGQILKTRVNFETMQV
jgi:alpha-D-ribose 1-methylphosphonate 5-triphosphate synthase subunit PhnG